MHSLGRQLRLPVFPIKPRNIKVLYEPQEFHATLKERISQAKERVTLSALYLGATERDLIDTLTDALNRNEHLRVRILLDFFRGTRATRYPGGQASSLDVLMPMKLKYPQRVDIALYRTPDMGRLLGRIAPSRWNETIGVQHTKVALFDNQLMLTGANLSHDYFTNRQDRYTLFEDDQLSDYFNMLTPSVAASHLISPAVDQRGPDPAINARLFRQNAANLLNELTQYWHDRLATTTTTTSIPALQVAPVGIRQDQHGLASTLASGYFNLHDTINTNRTNWQLLVAAPEANGFFTAKDVSRYIPAAYSLIEQDFMQRVAISHREHQYKMQEYSRPGWTFHAKGFWLEPKLSHHLAGPMLTTIGSPNFGYRSFERDVEAQAWIYSENTALHQQWHQDISNIQKYTSQVTLSELQDRSRNNPYWVPLVTKAIRRMM
ncbi:hypothetical protein BDF22DRAFT_672474 [Syncephalis plumigaleata]|nr:hypothetical protein BDF22DRAFT_672474 [Syncephalis plumigaleata]